MNRRDDRTSKDTDSPAELRVRDRAAPVRVLVVDDSAAIRRLVSLALGREPAIQVVGTARDGREALEVLDALAPDLVTLDIEMPDLDGIRTLTELRKRRPKLPIIMVSSLTQRGATATLDALGHGASDYVPKPDALAGEGLTAFAEQLCPRVLALVPRRPRMVLSTPPVLMPTPMPASGRVEAVSLVVIGASTGGPDAIAKVLGDLSHPLRVPIAIAQHMPPVFTTMFAERLSRAGARVVEAQHGQLLGPGSIVVAPGDHHLAVKAEPRGFVASVERTPPENSCRPSVDVLFRSAATAAAGGVLAVILTGLGRDGCAGAAQIAGSGGIVLAQDEETSVVWGMPGAVVRAGHAYRVLPLGLIGPTVASRVALRPRPPTVRRAPSC